jgi:FdrA protein
MTVVKVEIRSGAYYDSIILIQLQSSLSQLPGVLDAGVVMGTEANKQLLAHSGLLAPAAQTAQPDDLVIVLNAEDGTAAEAALNRIDQFLVRPASAAEQDYRPKSLENVSMNIEIK